MDYMNINRLEVARKLMDAYEPAHVVLYAIDLVLFNGENLEFNATTEKDARNLLINVIMGIER